jgi:hypothetical protein
MRIFNPTRKMSHYVNVDNNSKYHLVKCLV